MRLECFNRRGEEGGRKRRERGEKEERKGREGAGKEEGSVARKLPNEQRAFLEGMPTTTSLASNPDH
jgi:hypothetical protein